MDDSIDIPSATIAAPPAGNGVSAEGSTSTNAPVSVDRPDAKTRRYDRQLRLWGASGQGGLETARVLLINPVATGTQSLKNLVLPGIGHFSILSSHLTTPQDVGQNFFLTTESVGKPLATETVRYLKELNSSVEGEGRVADVSDLLDADPAYFLSFTLIIAVNLPASVEDRLSALLWAASDPSSSVTTPTGAHPDIPLILARSAGFVGMVRVQVREHTTSDTHPASLVSLRLDSPFPALLSYATSLDLASLDSMDHGNVPYPVILIRALEEWRSSHEGRQPVWSGKQSQKKEFLASVTNGRRHGDEENYAEAEEKGYLAAQVTKVPKEMQELYDDPKVVNVTKDSPPFHLLLSALRRFTLSQTPPALPLSAALPDMKSSTAFYITLQQLYKTKAREDLDAVKGCLAEVLRAVGLSEDEGPGEQETAEFVKMASVGGVGIVRGRSLAEERDVAPSNLNKDAILSFSPDPDWNSPYVPPPIVQYVAFRATDAFHAKHLRQPGMVAAEYDADVAAVESEAGTLLGSYGWIAEVGQEGLPQSVTDAVGEIVRAASSDLPTTAAYLGGVVAQEAIKLLTSQYVPLDNTVVVDLIRGATGAYRL